MSGADGLTPATAMTPRELAIQAEATDTKAWFDQYAAAPQAVASGLDLHAQRQGDLAMVKSHIPFSHFNIVLTLGCPAAVDDAAFATIDRYYAGRRHWVLVNDHSEPADLRAQLVERRYEAAGAWDRVVLGSLPTDPVLREARGCEIVDRTNADEWVAFIRHCYGMPPPIGQWLHALVGRRGWIHALRREQSRPGAPVVMVRSAFVADDGWCWLGIDAPVPGVMAPCFADDRPVIATLLAAAARQGAQAFVSDVEAVSPDRSGPAYANWRDYGFGCVYRRELFARG
jgi:hypothetical protein